MRLAVLMPHSELSAHLDGLLNFTRTARCIIDPTRMTHRKLIDLMSAFLKAYPSYKPKFLSLLPKIQYSFMQFSMLCTQDQFNGFMVELLDSGFKVDFKFQHESKACKLQPFLNHNDSVGFFGMEGAARYFYKIYHFLPYLTPSGSSVMKKLYTLVEAFPDGQANIDKHVNIGKICDAFFDSVKTTHSDVTLNDFLDFFLEHKKDVSPGIFEFIDLGLPVFSKGAFVISPEVFELAREAGENKNRTSDGKLWFEDDALFDLFEISSIEMVSRLFSAFKRFQPSVPYGFFLAHKLPESLYTPERSATVVDDRVVLIKLVRLYGNTIDLMFKHFSPKQIARLVDKSPDQFLRLLSMDEKVWEKDILSVDPERILNSRLEFRLSFFPLECDQTALPCPAEGVRAPAMEVEATRFFRQTEQHDDTNRLPPDSDDNTRDNKRQRTGSHY